MPYEIIDTHVHYWEPDRPDRPWDKGGVNIGPPLAVEQLIADADAAGVGKIVQVTPTIMGYDNRYGIECARRFPDRIVGVFVRFDPIGDDMPERLRRLIDDPAVIGVRLTLIKPPWDQWLAQRELEPFWEESARAGIPVAVYAPHQARLLAQAAHRHPQLHMLVDHMTLSHHDAEPFTNWSDVLELADEPNVWMKVSYLPEVAREPYPFTGMQRYFRELYDAFGSKRLMWGSNYPPSRAAASYKESVDFVRSLPFLSENDKARIFAKNFLEVAGLA